VLVELLLIALFDGLPARGELRFEAQRVRVDRAEERGALGALERVAGERHALSRKAPVGHAIVELGVEIALVTRLVRLGQRRRFDVLRRYGRAARPGGQVARATAAGERDQRDHDCEGGTDETAHTAPGGCTA